MHTHGNFKHPKWISFLHVQEDSLLRGCQTLPDLFKKIQLVKLDGRPEPNDHVTFTLSGRHRCRTNSGTSRITIQHHIDVSKPIAKLTPVYTPIGAPSHGRLSVQLINARWVGPRDSIKTWTWTISLHVHDRGIAKREASDAKVVSFSAGDFR